MQGLHRQITVSGVLFLMAFILPAVAIADKHSELQGAAQQEDLKLIRSALQSWTDAYNAGNWEGTLELWDLSAVVISPNTPDSHFEDLKRSVELKKREPRAAHGTYTFEIEDAQVCGDMAYVIDTWWLTTKLPDGSSRKSKYRSLELWRKGSRGNWKIIRAVLYPERVETEP